MKRLQSARQTTVTEVRMLPGIVHGFSTRLGGVSEGIYSTMNLSFHRGDDMDAVMENHRRLAQAVGYDHRRLVFSDQVHETVIRLPEIHFRARYVVN